MQAGSGERGFGASFSYFQGVWLRFCARSGSKVEPGLGLGSPCNCAGRRGRCSVLHFCTFKRIGFDFVPAPDRAESGAGLGLGSVLHFVSWRRLDSIFCACAAMVLSVPFKARDCDGCLPGCKVAGAEAPGDSVIRRLLKTGEIEVSQVGHRENWPPRNADRMK